MSQTGSAKSLDDFLLQESSDEDEPDEEQPPGKSVESKPELSEGQGHNDGQISNNFLVFIH